MSLIVQKFGGTSVGNLERISAIAKRIAIRYKEGHDLVVVVSAIGNTTDELMNMAYSIHPTPPGREIDMLLATGEQISIALLSIALNRLGISAISMTGSQVGIVTEGIHRQARILKVNTNRLSKYLEQNRVIIVAGFQGTTSGTNGFDEITTLGRGGSDTSAVAIAAALCADACEIYTDVVGILTTDPHIVETAQLIKTISCDEMLELASLGAAVLHPRAVEIARNYGVPLSVRSSWSLSPGTLLVGGEKKRIRNEGLEIGKSVDKVELIERQAIVVLSHLPDIPGIIATVFEGLANANLNVDLIVQTSNRNKFLNISFTLKDEQLEEACYICNKILHILKAEKAKITAEGKMAKISISGVGIMSRHNTAAILFESLAENNINSRIVATSEVKISCLIQETEGAQALKILLQAFDLITTQINYIVTPNNQSISKVRGVALDTNQVQISIRNVPDSLEIMAVICRKLADDFIVLYAILQSEYMNEISNVWTRDISLAINRDDLKKAKDILNKMRPKWPTIKLEEGPMIACVSAVGTGMQNTPGIAAQMFRSLSTAGINIQMIATSEIRTSCIVHQADGLDALQSVHSCFNLGGTI